MRINKLTKNFLQHFIIISLVAEMSTGCILGGSALGGRHLKAEEVGMKAADELFQSIYTGACVDSYSQDQVILNFLPQALPVMGYKGNRHLNMSYKGFGVVLFYVREVLRLTRDSKTLPPDFRSVVCRLANLGAHSILFKVYVDVCFQMILLMAIAHGKSRVKCGPVSLHTRTAIHVAHLLTEVRLIVFY